MDLLVGVSLEPEVVAEAGISKDEVKAEVEADMSSRLSRLLRLLLVDLLLTLLRFNISLSLMGALGELELVVGVASASSASRRLGTRSCSGSMLAKLVPATVQDLPEVIDSPEDA